MKKLLIVFAIIGIFTSCSSGGKKSSWKESDKNDFSVECVSGATASMGEEDAKKYCDCMLTKIMDKYPKAEEVGSINMDEMTKMAEDCVK
ncbi:MAG: hypothetical protein H7Y00_14600 [Fimbriimonadaceae bacterium]|nr:hypothetical protein [Chitinophagales bacterium]